MFQARNFCFFEFQMDDHVLIFSKTFAHALTPIWIIFLTASSCQFALRSNINPSEIYLLIMVAQDSFLDPHVPLAIYSFAYLLSFSNSHP